MLTLIALLDRAAGAAHPGSSSLATLSIAALVGALPFLAFCWAMVRLAGLRRENSELHEALQSRTVQNAMLAEQLRVATFRDALTGLPNRTAFDERAAQALLLSGRQKKPTSLLVMRLDGYAKLRSDLGDSGADDLFRQAAQLFARQLRKSDLLARGTGEELLLLLPATPLEGAMIAAERLRTNLEAAEVERDGKRVPLTISLGVGSVDLMPQSAPEAARQALVHGAEEAVVIARRQGGNRAVASAVVAVGPAAPAHQGPERRQSASV